MYSVNPSGNSTLSCNSGSISLPPECPWICSVEEVRIQTILKSFLGSSSFRQNRYPIVNWPLQSTIELYLPEFFQDVVSRTGTETEDSVCGFSRGLALATGPPWSSMLFILDGFCRFGHVLLTIRTKKVFCLETEIRPEFQYCNDLDGDKPSCQWLSRFSNSWESTLSIESSLRFEAVNILGIGVPSHLVLLYRVWRSIVLFDNLQTSVSTVLDNFWSSDNCSNLRS